ncbi:SDR family NAD(P)-dependent oxidoreductase [Rhodocytophaga rosea]|uniref:SDR family NAD(P)-dependent oxidoreductase n=1 Tax=Rhodocytophaga rosea TaxID=2704465 RepID=A0A6C0GRH5_9BACT|nr:oxidoreductase [Rhodocytophaga rosea]QHT70669.1 SDR family NAD(P)-dependent oxidoreductase [Rhodocytophaga rosea]
MDTTEKVWLITGASKGLGLALAKKVLVSGAKVIATSRNKKELQEAFGQAGDRFLPLEISLTDEQQVQQGIKEAIQKFGRIDVVVNNAGYGQTGTLEELTASEVKQNFEVNVFGSLHVIRYVMPHLREQGSGHIFNIASIGGFSGAFAGWGIYCATKFAVAGFTEALAAEVKGFGLHATVVYPGYFRTHFLSKESLITPANPIEAYEAARQSEAFHQQQMDGSQPGDPEKAADALIAISKEVNPPIHLFLGSDALELAGKKIETINSEIAQWRELSSSTNL